MSVTYSKLRRIVVRVHHREWDESLHPRDEEGKWTDKGASPVSSSMPTGAVETNLRDVETRWADDYGVEAHLGAISLDMAHEVELGLVDVKAQGLDLTGLKLEFRPEAWPPESRYLSVYDKNHQMVRFNTRHNTAEQLNAEGVRQFERGFYAAPGLRGTTTHEVGHFLAEKGNYSWKSEGSLYKKMTRPELAAAKAVSGYAAFNKREFFAEYVSGKVTSHRDYGPKTDALFNSITGGTLELKGVK